MKTTRHPGKTLLATLGFCLGMATAPFAQADSLPTLNCQDPHAAPAGLPTDHYDGFFIGANGCLYDPANTDIKDVPPMLGPNGDNGQRIWDVNGASTTPEDAAYEIMAIAITTKTPTIGIYNASSDDDSQLQDLAKGYILRNVPSIRSIANQLLLAYERQDTDTILLRGGSQGTVLMSRALQQVRATLAKRFRGQDQLNQAMASFQVETHGSVVRNFPDGPRYVHYVNLLDPAPRLLGVLATQSHPGLRAVIVVFAAKTRPLEGQYEDLTKFFRIFLSLHGEGNYLGHRVAFPIAYSRSQPDGLPKIVAYQQLLKLVDPLNLLAQNP